MKTIEKQSLNTIESLQKQIAVLQLRLDKSEEAVVAITTQKDAELEIKEAEIEKQDEKIKSLNHQLYLCRNAKFGRKSEKFDDSERV